MSNDMLHGDLKEAFDEYRADNSPADGSMTAGQVEYLARMADSADEHEASQTAKPDAFDKAVDQYRQDGNAFTNIHAVNAADVKFNAESGGDAAVSDKSDDWAADAEAFKELNLGGDAEFWKEHGCADSGSALASVKDGIQHIIDTMPPGAAFLASGKADRENIDRLRKIALTQIETWQSDTFGVARTRTAEQAQRVEEVWSAAQKLALAYMVRGGGEHIPNIKTVMRHARFAVDPQYVPGERKPPAASVFRNIHEAAGHNPF